MKETLKLFLKLEKRKLNNKLIKGVCTILSCLFFSLCIPPFQIYASEQTQIVPTWNWGSQYSSQFTVTNFCEGSGTSVSCELRFTANNSYYGYLSFDGYNGTTKWIDYKNVWIADGYGAYRYSLYQNGVIQINKINIEGGFLKSSMDNLDLQDIVDLLTAIETDTTSIDNQMNTELQRLQSIINNQITQNGYLQTLTKMRQWNFPIESFNFVFRQFSFDRQIVDVYNYSYYSYPIFNLMTNNILENRFVASGQEYMIIVGTNQEVNTQSELSNIFTVEYGTLSDFEIINISVTFRFIKFKIKNVNNTTFILRSAVDNQRIITIYSARSDYYNKGMVSTDFALIWGLDNRLLNDIHQIAQGTTESNSAATGLDSETSSFESVASGLYTSENSFNQSMNSNLQQIDTSFNPSTSFGSKFLYSADWVRSQFNTLTSQTPFGSVLSFSMLLGLSLLIIGKVFK